MLTLKTRFNNLFTGINSPHNPYPTYFSNFQEVGRLMGVTVSKYPELMPNYYQEMVVESAQKKQQFIAADTKCVDFKSAAMKPLNKKKNKIESSHNFITIQSDLVKLTDNELDLLTESGQLVYVFQKGRKILINPID